MVIGQQANPQGQQDKEEVLEGKVGDGRRRWDVMKRQWAGKLALKRSQNGRCNEQSSIRA